MKRLIPLLGLLLLTRVGAYPASSSGDYISRLRKAVTAWHLELPALEKSASAAAAKIIAGGHLYVGGTQKSLIQEAGGRSGGMVLCQGLQPTTALGPNDVVLLGAVKSGNADELNQLLQRTEAGGAQTILFSDSQRPQGPHLTVFPTKIFAVSSASGTGPGIESVSNVIGMWTWTAEFVGSCIRLGKMPSMFESMFMPGAKARDDLVRPALFHTHNLADPKAVPNLGQRYLDAVSSSLARLAEKNGGNFSRAATLLKESHARNQPVSVRAIGHMFPDELTSNPIPAWFSFADQKAPLDPNAVTVSLGYQWFPWEIPGLTVGDRVPCILTSSRHPMPDWVPDATHIYIDPCWEVQDAAVAVPGYDINILPISGVMQSAILWQLVGSLGDSGAK